MKTTLRCAKCDHPRVWHIDPVCGPDDSSLGVVPIRVATANLKRKRGTGWLAPRRPPVRISVGYFEAFVCEACGYSELYAKDLEKLAWIAGGVKSRQQAVHSSVELLEAPGGPYR